MKALPSERPTKFPAIEGLNPKAWMLIPFSVVTFAPASG